MKHTLKLATLLAALLLAAACDKENQSLLLERDIVYTVDDDRYDAQLKTDTEFEALLDELCDYTQEGSTVTFYNALKAQKAMLNSKGATKEVTYRTTSREEIKRWMRRMENEGRTVTITYDSAHGTWNGVAYATAPQVDETGAFDSRGATLSLFSVAEGSRVRFSRGNLQRHNASGIWQMAQEQYLFPNDNAEWTGIFEWDNDNTQSWTTGQEAAFSGLAGQWRILTEEEWQWLLEWRSASPLGDVAEARYACVTVGGVRGLLLFPDSYNHPSGVALPTHINSVSGTAWDENSYTLAEWCLMEDAGTVFLPMAGYLHEGTVAYTNARGRYWVHADPVELGLSVLAIDSDDIPGLSGLFVGITGWWSEMGAALRLVCSE